MSTITRPITVEEYERMIDDGTLDEDDHLELIEGRIVAKMPRNPPHRVATTKTVEALERVIPPAWHVARENAIVIRPHGKPEPDVAVVRAELRYDATRDPTAAECCLVVEVADTSLEIDRGAKLGIYTAAGIPVYWIVNLRDGQVEVYTEPNEGWVRYGTRAMYQPGQDVPVVIAGQAVGTIAVAELLPRIVEREAAAEGG